MLKILGKDISINVRKVLWACAELQLPFEHENWGIGEKKLDDPTFLSWNPNGLVPVIQDDDFVLWESNAIIRYLATRYGGEALYPATPQRRARVDQWMDWQASDLNRAWVYAFMALVKHSAAHRDADAIRGSEKAWTHHMRILNQQLDSTKAYVAGAAFSLADIPIALSTHRWLSAPIDHPALPAITDYVARLQDRPGFQRYCNATFP